jgi:hypothetical protein
MDHEFWDYYNHPESMFDRNDGILDRKHIQVDEIIDIEKESNKLEQSDVMGVDKDGYEFYDNGEVELSYDQRDLIISMGPKKCEEIGITQLQWYYIHEKIREGKSMLLPEIIYDRIFNNS